MQQKLVSFQKENKDKILATIIMVNSDNLIVKDTKPSKALNELNKIKSDIDKFK